MNDNKTTDEKFDLTDRNVRLRCLQLSMEFGSHNDRKEAVAKADELYRWVTGITDEAPDDSAKQSGQPLKKGPGRPRKD